jgi:hypothetical protein
MSAMSRTHPDDARKGVNMEGDLFDVRRVQLRQFREVTSKLAREFDHCLLRLSQSHGR